MADKAKPSWMSLADGIVLHLHEKNQLGVTEQQQIFLFLFNKEIFHFRMTFPKKPWDWESCSEAMRKVKKSWDSWHGRVTAESRALTSLGSRRAFVDFLIMFIACTSKKASKVHKRLSQCPREDNLSSYESYRLKALDTMHFYQGRSIYDNCRFDIRSSRVTRLIMKAVYT